MLKCQTGLPCGPLTPQVLNSHNTYTMLRNVKTQRECKSYRGNHGEIIKTTQQHISFTFSALEESLISIWFMSVLSKHFSEQLSLVFFMECVLNRGSVWSATLTAETQNTGNYPDFITRAFCMNKDPSSTNVTCICLYCLVQYKGWSVCTVYQWWSCVCLQHLIAPGLMNLAQFIRAFFISRASTGKW